VCTPKERTIVDEVLMHHPMVHLYLVYVGALFVALIVASRGTPPPEHGPADEPRTPARHKDTGKQPTPEKKSAAVSGVAQLRGQQRRRA
jgi:hypothetical protein